MCSKSSHPSVRRTAPRAVSRSTRNTGDGALGGVVCDPPPSFLWSDQHAGARHRSMRRPSGMGISTTSRRHWPALSPRLLSPTVVVPPSGFSYLDRSLVSRRPGIRASVWRFRPSTCTPRRGALPVEVISLVPRSLSCLELHQNRSVAPGYHRWTSSPFIEGRFCRRRLDGAVVFSLTLLAP
jgi:hypothetical protein